MRSLLCLVALQFAASTPSGVARRKVVAADGASLALYRFAPLSGGFDKGPVLLVGDIGFGRELFDLDGRGLARFLQQHGRDAFVLEARGQGASSAGAHLKDVAELDVPAALDAIASVHEGPVDLVAHGYLGTLALVAAANRPERLGHLVALDTPVEPEVPNALTEELLTHGQLTRRFPDPRAGATFEALFAAHSHFEHGTLSKLQGTMHSPGDAMASELLGWMRTGDLALSKGNVRSALSRLRSPTLLILALGDTFAHPEFASPLSDIAPHANVRELALSELNGLDDDSSHVALLLGANAAKDVFAPALGFLDEATSAPRALQTGVTPR